MKRELVTNHYNISDIFYTFKSILNLWNLYVFYIYNIIQFRLARNHMLNGHIWLLNGECIHILSKGKSLIADVTFIKSFWF